MGFESIPSSTRARRRTPAAAGAEPPAVHYGFGPDGAFCPSARRANTPPRVSRPQPPLAVVTAPAPAPSPAPTVPIPSGHDRTEPVGIPLLRLPPPHDVPSATTADLDALSAAAELQFGDSAACYSHADRTREQQVKPACHAALPAAIPTTRLFVVFSFAPAPPLLGDSGSCVQRPATHHQRRYRPARPSTDSVTPV